MTIKVGSRWVVPFYTIKKLRYQWAVVETHTGEIYELHQSEINAWNHAIRINYSIGFHL